jgi:hypothetical protein
MVHGLHNNQAIHQQPGTILGNISIQRNCCNHREQWQTLTSQRNQRKADNFGTQLPKQCGNRIRKHYLILARIWTIHKAMGKNEEEIEIRSDNGSDD